MMSRCPRLVAHLWAWTVATGWQVLEPVLYEDDQETAARNSRGFIPAGGIWEDG